MKNIIIFLLCLLPALAWGQFPANPSKIRLGQQTTAAGLVAVTNTSPPGWTPTNWWHDAFMALDTVNARLWCWDGGEADWGECGGIDTLFVSADTLFYQRGGNTFFALLPAPSGVDSLYVVGDSLFLQTPTNLFSVFLPPGVLDFSRSGDTLTLVAADTTYTVILPPPASNWVPDGTTIMSSGDTISVGVVQAANIAAGAVGATQIASTAVTPGTYTNSTVTVDGDGRLTAASSGANLQDSIRWVRLSNGVLRAVPTSGDTVDFFAPLSSLKISKTPVYFPGQTYRALDLRSVSPTVAGGSAKTFIGLDISSSDGSPNAAYGGVFVNFNYSSPAAGNYLGSFFSEITGAVRTTSTGINMAISPSVLLNTSTILTGKKTSIILPAISTVNFNQQYFGYEATVDASAATMNTNNNGAVSRIHGIRSRISTNPAQSAAQIFAASLFVENISKRSGFVDYGIFQEDNGVSNHFAGRVGIGTTSPAYIVDITGTGGIRISRGTTAQRGIGVTGYLRYNTTWTGLDIHNGTAFRRLLDLPDAAPAANAVPLYVSGAWTTAAHLVATATLDFPSTAAQTSSDLTITVTGAVVGETVSLGPPASVPPASQYTAWVSAANTVTVRHLNAGTAATDPASASFTVRVHKY